MAGRPRKPAALKAIEGNRGKRDLPQPLPLQGLPEFPSGLTPEGENFWRLVAGELGAVGVAKRIDGPALQLAAQAWEWTQRANAAYDLDSFRKAAATWIALSAKLGLTPVDRAKLELAATEAPDPTEERYFGNVVG